MFRLLPIALAVLLAGCGGQGVSETFAEVGESVPTGTPSQPTESTPRPTPTPTEEPSPTADPARAAAIEFLSRSIAGASALLGLYDDMVTAVNSPESAVELQLAAREMADWTDQERAWLLDHQPDECYAGAWDGYLQAVEAYHTLGDLMEAAAADPLNDLATQTALAALDDSIEALNAAGQSTESMTCARE